MSSPGWVAKSLEAHRSLPWFLRVWAFAPLTLALVIVLGFTFTLPPGPLCDEGMVLFMEGGCDYGGSNVFFFSKLGLLIAVNGALALAALSRRASALAFGPHLAALVALSLVFLTDSRCETYYSQPNGSLGQMTFEVAAFSFLGLGLVGWLQERPPRLLLVVLPLWNAVYVAVFYAWLAATPHWRWLHSALVVVSLIVAAVAGRLLGRSTAAGPDSEGLGVAQEVGQQSDGSQRGQQGAG